MLEAGAVYALLGGKFQPEGFEKFGAAMVNAKRRAEDFEKRHNGAMDRVTKATKTMAVGVAGAAATGLGAVAFETFKAVKSAAEFEGAMRNVNSIAKLSGKQFDDLSRKVLLMATRTGQKPKVLAEGLYDIVSSGFKANDAMKILNASANAATAGLTDTATSTKAVVAVLNSYHLGADQAGKVSDQLFEIVNRGVINFEELAGQIGDVLPFASSLGVGLDQLGGSIATITKGGVNASQTMTQVKGIFNQLLSPSDALQTAIKKTGASSAESLLKTKGFQGALEALVGTTDGSKAAVQALFPNVEALGGVLRLTGDNAKGARADLKAMADVSGATQSALDEQNKSFEVSARRFSAAWDAARIIVGQAVLPELTDKLKGWSQAIADAAADGRLDKIADDIGHIADVALNAFEGLAKGAPGFIHGTARALDGFLGLLTTIDDAILVMLKAWNKIPLAPDVDTSELERGIDRINKFREGLRGKPAEVKVTAPIDQALNDLRKLNGTKLEAKVTKILASDAPARQKMRAFEALGINPKTAIILATLQGIQTAEAALSFVTRMRNMTINVRYALQNSPNLLTPRPQKARAAGRGAIGAETALVGEGAVAREAIVDPATGTSMVVNGPTVMDIPDTAFVIPQDPAHRGRALGLLADLAKDLGLQGFKGGKKPKKKVRRLVPARDDFRIQDPDDFKDDIDKLDGFADDKYTADDKKGHKKGQLTAKAREARRELRQLRPIYRQTRRLANQIKAAEENAQNARDAMELADKKDDTRGYNTARREWGRHLSTEQTKLQQIWEALGKAKRRDTPYGRSIRGRLLKAQTDAADQREAAIDVGETEADRIADTGMTDAERKRLEDVDAAIALAALTQTLEDDKSAAGEKVSLLEGVLGQLGPRHASSSVVADIASQVKQARDNLSSLTGGGATNDNPDVQAQLDQANARLQEAETRATFNAAALSVFQGAGDIGTAPGFAGPNITINTLHPGDPQTLDAVARASVSGMDLQGARLSPRVKVGP